MAEDIAEQKPSLLKSKFTPVSNCSECQDFSVCAAVSGELRCLRRTLDHEPCPEMCSGSPVTQQAREASVAFARNKLDMMAETGMIPVVENCSGCEAGEHICIPENGTIR